MEDFHQQFSLDSVKNLKNLQRNLQSAKKISESERREVFRTLHTIKGTAQTFGFSAISHLAHELENLLSAKKLITSEIFQSLFTEGIELLINSFEQRDFELHVQFSEKIHRIIPKNLQSQTSFDILLIKIPPEIVESLSNTEKIAIDSALKIGKNIYFFEVGFDAAKFAEKLIEFRGDLTETGEIIAMFPSAELYSSGKIGFRILCANSAKKAQIEEIAKIYAAKIVFDISPENFTNDLHGIVLKAVAHGRDLARKLDKETEFTISGDEINVADEKLKLVFVVLIHLIRNAVDHGIKSSGGKIEVNLQIKEDGLSIIVTDNGNGINLEKIKAKAVEKNIISADEFLTEQATLDLIFQSELSTAPEITEISGRGIGLDAVKTSVEKSGGTIKVKSRNGKGTIFEVFLP